MPPELHFDPSPARLQPGRGRPGGHPPRQPAALRDGAAQRHRPRRPRAAPHRRLQGRAAPTSSGCAATCPDYPLMPGVLMCEAAAQLCSYYVVDQRDCCRAISSASAAWRTCASAAWSGRATAWCWSARALRLHRRQTHLQRAGLRRLDDGLPRRHHRRADDAGRRGNRRREREPCAAVRACRWKSWPPYLLRGARARRRRSTGPPSSATTSPSRWRSASARACSCSPPSEQQPDVNFVGVEIVRKYQLFTATRLAKRQRCATCAWPAPTPGCSCATASPGVAAGAPRLLSRSVVEETAPQATRVHARSSPQQCGRVLRPAAGCHSPPTWRITSGDARIAGGAHRTAPLPPPEPGRRRTISIISPISSANFASRASRSIGCVISATAP